MNRFEQMDNEQAEKDVAQQVDNLNGGSFPNYKDPTDEFKKVNEILPGQPIQFNTVRKKYTDFFTAGLGPFDVDLFTLPKLCQVISCFMDVQVAFAGTSTYTLSVGKDTAETGMLVAQDVKTSGIKSAIGTDFTTNQAIFSSATGTKIQARATSTVNNLNLATAGTVDFYVAYISYPGNV